MITAILAILSGLLYRAGGKGKPFHTTYRDAGCPLVTLAALYFSGVHGPWWSFVLSYGALYGALTTYHKYLSKWLYKTDDVTWVSWAMTGLCYGLAMMFFYQYWPMVLARSFALMVFICIWSEGISDAFWEEFGRGVLLVATVPIITA